MNRGDVYRVALPRQRGHVRYAVVVQADEFMALSTAIVAPTSQSAPGRTFRPVIAINGEPTRVLVEQLRAVDATALRERVGRLAPDEQRAVDDALGLVLGLS